MSNTTNSNRHHRKQRFPRLDRRKLFHDVYRSPSPSDLDDDRYSCDGEYVNEDEELYCKRPRLTQVAPPNRPSTIRTIRQPATTPGNKRQQQDTTSCRLDKRARDEHNEQERSRRRELAVIYELIRCSFSEDDLRYLGQCSGPKSVEKLSYPQVLQIAYQLLLEEQHNLVMFEKSLQAIKLVEKEYLHVGLPIPQRPFCPAIPDSHRKVVQVVDSLLKQDKSARTPEGVYEVTPAERAAIGDHQLSSFIGHPTSGDHDMLGANNRPFQTSTGLAASPALTGHSKSQSCRPSSLVIMNGTGSGNGCHVNSATRLQKASSPQIVHRPLVSAGSSSSSSRATVHRNAFRISRSHSDSSSGAGSPRVGAAGVDSSPTDGSAQQLMVFDWLGLKDGASSCLVKGGVKTDEEDSCLVAQPRRRGQPFVSDRLLIRTSDGRSTGLTWNLRQQRQQLRRRDQQDLNAEDEGVVIDLMPNRSLVSRSIYSNAKA